MTSSLPRTIFIGDVHGCLDELEQLVRKVCVSRDDRVVLVGDLVAKGPDSVGVVRFARERGALSVLGNHDDAVLRVRRAQRAGLPEPKLKADHRAVAKALSEADWQWLESLPLYLRFPELNVAVVHAGVIPGRPVEAQDRDTLLTLRTLRPDGSGSARLDDGPLWASAYAGPEHIVFGHNAISGLQQTPFATGLDTGCVYGGELTAWVLPERTLVSVPAQRVYKEIDG